MNRLRSAATALLLPALAATAAFAATTRRLPPKKTAELFDAPALPRVDVGPRRDARPARARLFRSPADAYGRALAVAGASRTKEFLPHESHGYRARESVLHTLAEMVERANRFCR